MDGITGAGPTTAPPTDRTHVSGPIDIAAPVTPPGLRVHTIAPPRPEAKPLKDIAARATVAADVIRANRTDGTSRASQLVGMAGTEPGVAFILRRSPTNVANPKPFEVRVRRPSITYLMMTGRVPAQLTHVVEQIIQRAEKELGESASNPDAAAPAAATKISMNDIPAVAELAIATAVEGFLDPRLYVPHPESMFHHLDGTPANPDVEIPTTMIDLETDIMGFFSWCNESDEREAEAMRGFPVEPDVHHPAVPDERPDERTAIPAVPGPLGRNGV